MPFSLEIFHIFCTAFLISWILIFTFRKIFPRLGIMDNPKKYGKKRAPIPYSMGVVFFLTFFLVSFFTVEYNYKVGLIWIFGFVVSIVSFADDQLNLSAKIRLIIQIIIGLVIGATSIKIGYVSNIFGGIIDLEGFSFHILNYEIFLIPLFFTMIWYVFVFNALNWSDGIQGNTSGISTISFFILFLLGLILFFRDDYEGGIKNAEFIIKSSIILVGTLIPFWCYDVREKILMGDSGTMYLGFMLATLAIISGGKIATVLVVFGIYSVDAIYVIITRLLKKKNPMVGDFTHIHHRLQDLGLTKNQVLFTIYSLSFLFGLTALFLETKGKIIVFLIIVVVVVFMNKIIEGFKKVAPNPNLSPKGRKE